MGRAACAANPDSKHSRQCSCNRTFLHALQPILADRLLHCRLLLLLLLHAVCCCSCLLLAGAGVACCCCCPVVCWGEVEVWVQRDAHEVQQHRGVLAAIEAERDVLTPV